MIASHPPERMRAAAMPGMRPRMKAAIANTGSRTWSGASR